MKLKLVATRDEAGNAKTFIFEPDKHISWLAEGCGKKAGLNNQQKV